MGREREDAHHWPQERPRAEEKPVEASSRRHPAPDPREPSEEAGSGGRSALSHERDAGENRATRGRRGSQLPEAALRRQGGRGYAHREDAAHQEGVRGGRLTTKVNTIISSSRSRNLSNFAQFRSSLKTMPWCRDERSLAGLFGIFARRFFLARDSVSSGCEAGFFGPQGANTPCLRPG